ncbi:heat-inducible transcriptional repressor HrcA [Thermotoga profunda]|uniref:heat-inducible transcriptional repressor HrcA n=1 Tax=Thermotoga profunda TaxID=1508420 RepID=UPI000597BBB4|nr:heat-inducible transcriptional repressor HrcA [Thermotoga profunda]
MKREAKINERQKKILYCVVREYILTKKPISSERVLEASDVSCSSATVRNDLRKLEYLGYLHQPHTSAGRIPTDKGYRFYVDETLSLIREYAQHSASIHSKYPMTFGDMEKILTGAAIALSRITKGAVVLEKPAIDKLKILRISIAPITKTYNVVSLITELGLVKFIPFRTFYEIDYLSLENLMNELLRGYTIESVGDRKFETNIDQYLLDLSEHLVNALKEDSSSNLVKVGIDTLINAEYFNIDEIRRLSNFFSDDSLLKKVLLKLEQLPKILIGSEHGIQGLENFAIFVDGYKKEEKLMGKVMVITSKVVKYEDVSNSLRYMVSRLTEYFTVATREEGRR